MMEVHHLNLLPMKNPRLLLIEIILIFLFTMSISIAKRLSSLIQTGLSDENKGILVYQSKQGSNAITINDIEKREEAETARITDADWLSRVDHAIHAHFVHPDSEPSKVFASTIMSIGLYPRSTEPQKSMAVALTSTSDRSCASFEVKISCCGQCPRPAPALCPSAPDLVQDFNALRVQVDNLPPPPAPPPYVEMAVRALALASPTIELADLPS